MVVRIGQKVVRIAHHALGRILKCVCTLRARACFGVWNTRITRGWAAIHAFDTHAVALLGRERGDGAFTRAARELQHKRRVVVCLVAEQERRIIWQ